MAEKIQLPSVQKNLRNEKIFLHIACGSSKEDVCQKYGIGLRQLNRILAEANEEAEEWYKSLPRKMMIQIFRHNCSKIFQEIQLLEQIRNGIKDDPETKFEMTMKIVNAYSSYNRTVADGPSFTRQKEVVDAAEKLLEKKAE